MNTWIEISKSNLIHNIKEIKKTLRKGCLIAPAVKGNAYGHGIEICTKIIIEAGADFISVFSLEDLRAVRQIDKKIPVLIMGYVGIDDLEKAVDLNPRFSIFNEESLAKISEISTRPNGHSSGREKQNKKVFIHLKLETGFNRFGINKEQIPKFLKYFKNNKNLILEGAYSHFANIEDTVDRAYGEFQVDTFNSLVKEIEKSGFKIKLKHISNGASTVLYPKSHFDLVRTGLINYGMWPSQELYKKIDLKPVLTWKSIVAQIKTIDKGEYIGYGCTYKTVRKSKIASVPVGYYDGFDRGLGNIAHVLINGQRAPVRGRVCMNVIMVDVTDITNLKLEDEVVLIGKQGSDEITAEEMASWANTINYEVTTRINERIPRVLL